MHPEGLESLIEQAREFLPDMGDWSNPFCYVPIEKDIDIEYMSTGPLVPLFIDRGYVLRFRKEYISGIAVRWVFDGLDQGGF